MCEDIAVLEKRGGRRTKANARRRLEELGVEPGFLPESAAFCGMSPNSFAQWVESDPDAPQPVYLGQRCKRFRIDDLKNAGRAAPASEAA